MNPDTDPLGPISCIDDIGIRHLRYFLTVARRGSVSAAAHELRVSQPSLSQQIIRLERRVGFGLFDRTPRGVELTAAGRAFLKGIEPIPNQIRAAVAAASPRSLTVTIGVCVGISYTRIALVPELIRQSIIGTGASNGVPDIQLRSIASRDQSAHLRAGDIDLGVVRLPLTRPDLTVVPFSKEELGVVVAARHPLARLDAVRWSDLAGQRLLWVDPAIAPELSQTLLTDIRRRGWDPTLEGVDDHGSELMIHALQNAPGATVALRPMSALHGHSDLQWRPLAESPLTEPLALAALTGTPFAELLERMPSPSE